MPPGLVYERPASVDVNIRHVDIGPRMIDPARPIPAMIDYVVLAPVKVHAQPAPDCQTKAVRDKGRRAGRPAIFIYDRIIILGNVHIVRLNGDDLEVLPVDNYLLF